MKHSAIVSIDLGSAYTKIGIRSGWNNAATTVSGLSFALENDEDYCIPSVVARVERSGGSQWLIGVDAAALAPGPGVRIYRNWKSALFQPAGSGGSFTAAYGHAEAAEVAVAFLTQLRKVLLKERAADISGLPVRVAVPKLLGMAGVDDLVCPLLTQAGWDCATCRPTVFEPESNAIGLLSRGRNKTWTPPQRSFRPPPGKMIAMQWMFETGLSSALRTMSDHYGVLITDVGAFTTDFGYVKIDSSFRDDDWNRPEITQQSVLLGIQQLDDAILGVLEPEVREYFEARPPAEWERRKRELYAGKPQRVMVGGKPVTIGSDLEAEAIQDEVRRFSGLVCEARNAFCNAHGLHSVHEEAVTGGGSAIQLIRVGLLDSIRLAERRAHDLWDPNEPDAGLATRGERMTPHAREARRLTNRVLVRGASAIGAASVFFE
jgi:hypothetical protein